jgi:hypothetical protein
MGQHQTIRWHYIAPTPIYDGKFCKIMQDVCAHDYYLMKKWNAYGFLSSHPFIHVWGHKKC